MRRFETPVECGDEIVRLKQATRIPDVTYLPYELASSGWIIARMVRVRRKEDPNKIFLMFDAFV